MRILNRAAIVVLGLAVCVKADVKTKEIEYRDGETILKGFLAYDDAVQGKRPGVVVIHEWWGHNDYARGRAEQLARLGYVAFAADMYGDGKKTDDPKQAGEWAGPYYKDRALLMARFNAALNTLKQQEQVDPTKIAATGYCFGGSVCLEALRGGADLVGVVSFHGGLSTSEPAKPGTIKGKVLVCTGADDPLVPQEQVDGFVKEMREARADYYVVSYGGALHAFTNPAADTHNMPPVKYNAKADMRSWEAMKAFLAEVFAG